MNPMNENIDLSAIPLRDYFAGKFMQELLKSERFRSVPERVAYSYAVADLMLKKRLEK